jgi:hypothetical protein
MQIQTPGRSDFLHLTFSCWTSQPAAAPIRRGGRSVLPPPGGQIAPRTQHSSINDVGLKPLRSLQSLTLGRQVHQDVHVPEGPHRRGFGLGGGILLTLVRARRVLRSCRTGQYSRPPVRPTQRRLRRTSHLKQRGSPERRNEVGETTVNKTPAETPAAAIKINNLDDTHCVRDAGTVHFKRSRRANVGIGACESGI